MDVEDPQIRLFLDELERDEDIDRAEASRLLASANFLPKVIEDMRRAPERTIEWGAYRAIFMDAGRISSGQAFSRLHAETLAKVERDTGVPQTVVLGILGVETRFRTNHRQASGSRCAGHAGVSSSPAGRFLSPRTEGFPGAG